MRSQLFQFTPYKYWCMKSASGIRSKCQRGYSPIIMRSTTTAQKNRSEIWLFSKRNDNYSLEVSRLRNCRRCKMHTGRASNALYLMPALWPEPYPKDRTLLWTMGTLISGYSLSRKVLLFSLPVYALVGVRQLLPPMLSAEHTVASKQKKRTGPGRRRCYRQDARGNRGATWSVDRISPDERITLGNL